MVKQKQNLKKKFNTNKINNQTNYKNLKQYSNTKEQAAQNESESEHLEEINSDDNSYHNEGKNKEQTQQPKNKLSESKKEESDSEEQEEENLFNDEHAKKFENDNLTLESSLFEMKKNKNNNDKKAKGFRSFNLSQEILFAIKKMGYKFPTPIQRKAIPSIMSGFNVIAHSRTGSGKTAAFVLPILHRLKEHSKIVGCRCLIVCPTRELAHQTMSFCRKLGKNTNLKYALLVGGNELEGQFERLAQNPDIIIATPGRVMHHLVKKIIFKIFEIFICFK